MVVAALGCVLALTACATSGSHDGPPAAQATPSSLPTRVSSSIATDHGPATLVVTADAIYVGNHRGGSIQRIDPTTNRVVSTTLVGGQLRLPTGVEPSVPLWVCTNVDGVLHQVDLDAGRVTATVAADCDGGWLNTINGDLWAVSGGDQPNLRVIDARTGKVLRTAPLDQYSGGAVLADGRVLIGSGKSGKTPVFTLAGGGPTEIPVETPWLWSAGGKLYRIPSNGDLAELDPVTLAVIRTYHVPAHTDYDPALVADDAGHLYYRPDNTHIYRVDIASGTVDQFMQLPWEEAPTGLAFGFGSLWITNFDQDTVWRVNTAA
jgi:DNA-binding beta-propeller fold protein YncE